MNTVYQTTLLDEPTPMQLPIEDEGYSIEPLGTFAGTIDKPLYFSNRSFVPSDTSKQLIADGLR